MRVEFPTLDNNLLYERRFLGLTDIAYSLFLKYYIWEHFKNKLIPKLILAKIAFSVFIQLFITVLTLKYGLVNLVLYAVWAIALINFCIQSFICYILIKSKRRQLVILAIAVFIFLSGNSIGLFFHTVDFNFINNPNPFIINLVVFILEIIFFNFLINESFYKKRNERILQQEKMKNEIRDLERSALQAQMNPHFIFNCLNSIQRFIQDNEKDKAMDYLAKFARLVRQSLTASTESKILLDQEISMLDNYLALEKLRFKNRFDYSIDIADNIDPLMIRIPPLLIQPYVENAVVHGMKNKDSGGLISVSFKIEEENLYVSVKDNGTVDIDSTVALEEHKSLGMSITQKRIAYNNNLNSTDFKIEPIYSSDGTEVNITISV